MLTRRTALVVGLLVLAGGLAAPALVGPMLLTNDRSDLQVAREPLVPAAGENAVGAAGAPSMFATGSAASGKLVALPPADGTGVTATGAAFSAESAGAITQDGWSGDAVAGGSGSPRSRGRNASGTTFPARASSGSGTPGLLGWGLSERRGSAAGFEVATATGGGNARLSAAGQGASAAANASAQHGNESENSDGQGPQNSVHLAAAAEEPAGILGHLGITPQNDGTLGTSVLPQAAGGSGGSMPAATPEPATLLLVGGGAALAGLYRSRRRQG